MLILVTRPEPQATQWAELLQAAGLKAAPLPLLAMTPPADPLAVVDAWQHLARHRCVMFVSPNAVTWFARQRPGDIGWPSDTLAATPGPGTAQEALGALAAAGLRPSQLLSPPPDSGQFDSEHLWPLLAPLDWQDQAVLIVGGGDQVEVKGRQWLTERWHAAGATVTTLLAYTRGAPDWGPTQRTLAAQALARPDEHLWLLSSSQAIEQLADRVQPLPAGCRALCTHPKVAERARQAGFEHIVDSRPQATEVVQTCLRIGATGPSAVDTI